MYSPHTLIISWEQSASECFSEFLLDRSGNSTGDHCVLCVDCCSTIIVFAQYIQEASFEEVEVLVKAMTEYRDKCLGDMTLPRCSKLAVSKLFAFLKQISLFVKERIFWLEILKKKMLYAPSFFILPDFGIQDKVLSLERCNSVLQHTGGIGQEIAAHAICIQAGRQPIV